MKVKYLLKLSHSCYIDCDIGVLCAVQPSGSIC